ncbi:alpha/beta fold hydrolase, partial [Alteromonas sp. KUL49]|uniref:alpha/beta hydrolase family protein n=1 Tax=Alteromonas sp. KUL49 TaxID=2480798 RepID=UPI00102F0BAD
MKLITTLLLMLCALLPSIALSEELNPFSSKELQIVDKSIPFNSYNEWFNYAKENTRNVAQLDRWQKSVNPSAFERLISTTEAYWIAYQSDGLNISGVMAYPKNYQGEKLPVVIYNRGGNHKHNVSRTQLLNLIMPLAEKGYLVIASNYRGAKFSEGKDEYGGKDVNDVLRLIEVAKTLPGADTSRVAMIGFSRGGMMTWQALRREQDSINTAIIVAGVTDQSSELLRRPEMLKLFQELVPMFDANRDAEVRARSAIHWLDELNTQVPLLLIHGDSDVRVDVSNST